MKLCTVFLESPPSQQRGAECGGRRGVKSAVSQFSTSNRQCDDDSDDDDDYDVDDDDDQPSIFSLSEKDNEFMNPRIYEFNAFIPDGLY